MLLMVVAGAAFAAVMSWEAGTGFYKKEYTYLLGCGTWGIFTLHAQRILDRNLFLPYGLIASGVSLIALLGSDYREVDTELLLIAGWPGIYLALFKILVLSLFPNYPAPKIPIVGMPTRFGADWRGKEGGYKLTKQEKILSVSLYFGTLVIVLGGVILLKVLF